MRFMVRMVGRGCVQGNDFHLYVSISLHMFSVIQRKNN